MAALLPPALPPRPAGAGLTRRQYQEALRRLEAAARDRDLEAYREGFRVLLRENTAPAVRDAVNSYAGLFPELPRDVRLAAGLGAFHGRIAAAFAGVADPGALRELERLRRSSEWPGRLLLLDACAFNEQLDLEAASLAALQDDAPQVVRRALRYLARDRKVPVVEAIGARYLELERRKGRSGDSEWQRTLLGFEAALSRLLRVDLRSARDWMNYIEARKDREDFFDPPPRRGPTGLTLFGTAVTGRNIVFVLDISGSMVATDPPPPEELAGRRSSGRTALLRKGGEGERSGGVVVIEPGEERRRIRRAKAELTRVIRALPEEVRFNIVAFSSEVRPWRQAPGPATKGVKDDAARFVAGLEAQGITVTDLALEEAFSDLEVDTIYLITDGAPTHIGLRGPGKPEDADALIAEIHRRVEELNFLRGVRIFTLGFEGAEEDFLRKLSAHNGGRYVRIR